MKICELNVQNHQDRMDLVKILAVAGYKVSSTERKKEPFHWSDRDYFVVVEVVTDGIEKTS